MKLGINAARARSGGAVAHLVGILGTVNPREFGIREVHVWGYQKLVQALPKRPWLKLHIPGCANRSILLQLLWERFTLPTLLDEMKCDLLFNVDAGSICRFKPAVTASQDMLSYEPGEMQRYCFSRAWLRLWVLKLVQNAALRWADGAIFLTRYAGKVIQGSCGKLQNVAYIPHGVGSEFKKVRHRRFPSRNKPIQILYISNIAPYKHPWMVVEAVAHLRAKGYDLRLSLVGGGEKPAKLRLERCMAEHDPKSKFVKIYPFVEHADVPKYLAQADLFVFASSCENMPVTLLEAMAAGLPIACSDRGPMPEVLKHGGVYFKPEDPGTIAAAMEILITDSSQRKTLAERASQLAGKYSWERCGKETFSFLAQTAKTALL